MHPPLYAVFRNESLVNQAIVRLEALGIPHDAMRTISASTAAHVGSFADNGADHQHTPDRDHIGSFADSGADHQHTPERDHVGSFADNGADHQHTSERDHVGSFATTDHRRVALEDELTLLGLPASVIPTTLAQLQAGAFLLVVQPAPALVDAAAAALNG